jgi:DNA adenine methylase
MTHISGIHREEASGTAREAPSTLCERKPGEPSGLAAGLDVGTQSAPPHDISPGAGGPPAPIVADGAAVVRPEPAPMSPGAGSPPSSHSAAFRGVSPLEPAPSGAPTGGAGAVLDGSAPTRPVLRWHGGKWKLAPWIISHFPRHLVYVEPFGGAASVLLRKQQAPTEVYNDLDTEVVNLFRVLRSADAKTLIGALRLTPFARAEFDLAFEVATDPVERARRLVVRSFFAGGSRGVLDVDRAKAGFNGGSARSRGDKPQRSHASDWSNYADALPAIIDRMMAVVIENRPAGDLMKQHDGTGTLFYVDPPYLGDVRSDRARNTYRHELTDTDHRGLLQFLEHLQGMVVLSGYPHALYDELLSDWRRVERTAMADGARPRIEVLWINPSCAAALDRESQDFHAMMEGAAE